MKNALGLLLLLTISAHAVIIQADRRVVWQGNVGVNGGIPARTTVYTNLPAGSSVSAVSTALHNCPASNVVQLAAGAYTFSGSLDWQGCNNGVVLRGTTNALGHATNTQITFSSGQLLWRGSDAYDLAAMANVVALSAQPGGGDTTVQVASQPAWLKAGELYLIHQLENSNFVSLTGIEDSSIINSECRWCQTLNEKRSCAQTVKVIGISGSGPYTLTLDLPLLFGWDTTLSAKIGCTSYDATSYTHKIGWGLEDLEIIGGYSTSQQHMMVSDAIECGWIKNCFFYNTPGGTHTMSYFCYRMSVVDSRFDTAHSYAAGQGYGVGFNYGSSYCLCQNNIFKDLHIHMSSSYGGGGHVFAYNVSFGSGSDGNQYVSIGTHGAHTFYNLWEGNYCEDKVFLDYIHGSSSHQTFLRNYLIGYHATQGAGLVYTVGNDKFNRTNNFVGNIIGSKAEMTTKEHVAPGGSDRTAWVLGNGTSSSLSNDTYGHDDATTGAWLRHGNLTLYNSTSALDWDGGIADHVIPDSYYLASKPSWFGDRTWPPLDTNSVLSTVYTNIPAGYLYEFGTNPPPGISSYVEHKGLKQSRSKGSLRR